MTKAMMKHEHNVSGHNFSKPPLLRAAVACDDFGQWFYLAAERHTRAWMSYPAAELAGRLEKLALVLSDCQSAIPQTTARRLFTLIASLRDELRDAAAGRVSIGVFLVDDVHRAMELVKYQARKAGHADPRLAASERSGLLQESKQSKRVSEK